MSDEIQYERTEFDRVSPAVQRRYERISRERGITVVPLDSFWRDADGHRPLASQRDAGDQDGAGNDLSADAGDADGSVGGGRFGGFLGRRTTEE